MNTFPRNCRRRFQRLVLLLCLFMLAVTPGRGLAWSEPHKAITRAALAVLAGWQREVLKDELAALADYYCMIPDFVQNPALLKDKGDAKFASMESERTKVYLLKLHLPAAEQAENLETLRYFMGKAVAAFQAGRVGDGARYMGTICHMLEDFGSPSHTIPGDNMFTLLQQFLPPSEGMKGKLLHGPVESGTLKVDIQGYQPRLLGATVEEAAWRLLHRLHEAIINARSTTFPIIQALNAGDAEAVTKHQMKAAKVDAQVVADALYTILCLSAKRMEGGEQEALRRVGFAAHWPVEAVNLYYPQSHFFGSPHWGHARVGVVLEEGTKETPLKLRIAGGSGTAEKMFTDGISTGMGRPLTYLLPKDVYARFTVLAGLQAGIGDKGRVTFTVLGDGKPLATATVGGGEAAHAFDCDLSGVTLLQLAASSGGGEAKSNYAVWAEPVLWKGGGG